MCLVCLPRKQRKIPKGKKLNILGKKNEAKVFSLTLHGSFSLFKVFSLTLYGSLFSASNSSPGKFISIYVLGIQYGLVLNDVVFFFFIFLLWC
jgi:hypothetical protein